MRDKMKFFLNKLLNFKMKSVVAMLLSIVLLLLCTTVSFAWFVFSQEINPDLSFTAGAPGNYIMYQITLAQWQYK